MSVSFFYSIIFSSWDEIPGSGAEPRCVELADGRGRGVLRGGSCSCNQLLQVACAARPPSQRELGRKWVYSGFI